MGMFLPLQWIYFVPQPQCFVPTIKVLVLKMGVFCSHDGTFIPTMEALLPKIVVFVPTTGVFPSHNGSAPLNELTYLSL